MGEFLPLHSENDKIVNTPKNEHINYTGMWVFLSSIKQKIDSMQKDIKWDGKKIQKQF